MIHIEVEVFKKSDFHDTLSLALATNKEMAVLDRFWSKFPGNCFFPCKVINGWIANEMQFSHVNNFTNTDNFKGLNINRAWAQWDLRRMWS